MVLSPKNSSRDALRHDLNSVPTDFNFLSKKIEISKKNPKNQKKSEKIWKNSPIIREYYHKFCNNF